MRRPPQQRTPPHRDPLYLGWIRTLPCHHCFAAAPSDPHHVVTGGVGRRCSDYLVVPLCRSCHRAVQDSKRQWALPMALAALHYLATFMAQLRAAPPRPPVPESTGLVARVVQPGAEGPPQRVEVNAKGPF